MHYFFLFSCFFLSLIMKKSLLSVFFYLFLLLSFTPFLGVNQQFILNYFLPIPRYAFILVEIERQISIYNMKCQWKSYIRIPSSTITVGHVVPSSYLYTRPSCESCSDHTTPLFGLVISYYGNELWVRNFCYCFFIYLNSS